MEWISSRPIAHRGLHNATSIPENSLKAFQAAIDSNYPIELDLNLMSDGNLAVFHDSNLDRMTGVAGTIYEQTAETIQHLKLQNTNQHIPLLEEALELIAGRVPILIEIKNEGSVGKLETILRKKLDDYAGDYAIQSFNPYSLGWFKDHAPQIIRGQLSTNFKHEQLEWYQNFLLTNLLMNWVSQPHFIAYDLRFLPNPQTSIAKKVFSLPILAWTIRTDEERKKAFQYADNIIFENISLSF